MSKDRLFVYLLVPERKDDGYTTRLRRAVVRPGLAGREDLVEIARLIQEKA